MRPAAIRALRTHSAAGACESRRYDLLTVPASGPHAAPFAPALTESPERAFARPVVVLSRCLELEACRFDGRRIHSDFVHRLGEHVRFVPICPEVEIGLGVPRDPIRLVRLETGTRLVQPATGRDVTEALEAFAGRFLDGLAVVDGFLLKGRSPTCGIKDVKVYAAAAQAPVVGREAGRFGALVRARFPHVAIEDEGRLRHPVLRAHFLTRIFTRAAFRAVVASGALRELVAFHAHHKLLFMACDQRRMRALGGIVGNAERRPFDEVARAYGAGLEELLARPPGRGAMVNVVQHAFGYVSDDLSDRERRYFLDLLERYRTGRAGLSAVLAVLVAWIARFDVEYLAGQSFLEPFPRPLAVLDEV